MDDDKKVEPHEELAELDEELTEDDKAYFESGGELPDEPEDDAAEAAEAGEGAEAGQEGAEGDEAGVDAGPEKDGDGKQRTVPHGALHAEREEHKKTKHALSELKEYTTRLDERVKMLADLHKPQEQEQEQVPDPEEDLYGYVRHLEGRLAKTEQTSTQTAETTQQDREQREATSDLQTAYAADARRFVAEQADFGDAYHFLVGSRAQEYEITGVTDPAEIAKLVQQEEMELAKVALGAGESPAERLYKMAKLRGYTPPAPEQTDGGGENVADKPNGKAEGTEKLKQIAKAQEENKSLSNVSGAAGGALTAEALAEMSEEEFQEVYERLKKEDPKQLQALMM